MYLDNETLALEFVLLAERRELRRVTALYPYSVSLGERKRGGYSRGAFMSVPTSLCSFELFLQ